MKVAVLWTGLSGYLNACLKELAARKGVELFVSHQAPESNAPYDEDQFAWMPHRFMWRAHRELRRLDEKLREFAPDIMVLASWHIPTYRRLALKNASRSWRVMIMDNPWRGTLKQRIGTLVSPYYLHPMTDLVWLPGERQSVFARRLGFEQKVILRGSFSCDQPEFSRGHLQRIANGRPVPRSFLFAGRFIQTKGIDTLAKGYQIYREICSDPWPLTCCGAGPLKSCLENKPGIKLEGFVQPEQMYSKLATSGCFVLPSEFEPWGLVIHEAASAGMLILASEKAGAAVHLVQPNYNGFIFGNRDPRGLAEFMRRVSGMSDARLDAMSRASNLLSEQYTPCRWADTLLEAFRARA